MSATTYVLSNVARLYDGRSSSPESLHAGVDLHLRAGRVVLLRPHDPALRDGPEHRVLDCAGLVVAPGLVDCHGHITALGLGGASIDRMNGALAPYYVERILNASLVEGGVTTMRDVGGATHWMKRAVDEGLVLGPRLVISICMLSSTGGHADFRGPDRCHAQLSRLWPPAPGRPSSIVDGPWECRKRVRELAGCGADLIKLCTSPGVASPGDQLQHRDFTAEEIRAICDEAAGRGLRVAAHAHSESGIRLAIENGVHDLQHVSFMTEELVELAFARGCAVTPTSWVLQELPGATGLSAFVMEKVKQVAEVHARAVAYARAGGLKVLAGTDPVLPGMHGRNWMELVALVRDGLSPLEAWHGMTGLAAAEIGRPETGTLAPGQRADLVVCDQDVLADPARFGAGALREVIKDGEGYRGGLAGLPQRRTADAVRVALAAAGAGREEGA